jgi:methionyl-tRNA formyltransferase
MKKTSETIVVFGSGPVAAKSLELLNEDFEIELVITKPKPTHHRGDFPVLQVAEKLGLKTLTVTNKTELSSLFTTKPAKSQMGIVIDFGIIITKDVIDYFPLGILNSHFSLLPQWRGADPITFSILSGQDKTGVSLMLITEGLDEGPIIGIGEQELAPTVTTPELTDKLIHLSHGLLVHEVPRYMAGETKGIPQEKVAELLHYSPEPTYSRKLTKEDGIIDWEKPAEVIKREIRAFIEWPKSRTQLANKDVIITKAHVVSLSGNPGKITLHNKELVIYCGKDALVIDELKPAGKKVMTGQEFLRGYRLKLEGKEQPES